VDKASKSGVGIPDAFNETPQEGVMQVLSNAGELVPRE
jgi:hypothetical protein